MVKEFEYKGMKYKNYIFDSLNEFNEYLKSDTIKNSDFINNFISEDKSFFGISSLEENDNYIKNGYKKSIETLKESAHFSSKCFDTGDRKRLVQTNSYCGCKPNISRYVLGLPNNMTRLVKKTKAEKKVLNFLYDLALPFYVTSEIATEKFSKIFQKIYTCCLKGYKVRISLMVGIFPTSPKEQPFILKIPLKKENEIINLSKLSYALMHVGYFRTEIVLKFIKIALRMHGTKGFYAKTPSERNDLINLVSPKNETGIYLNYESDIETIFSKL